MAQSSSVAGAGAGQRAHGRRRRPTSSTPSRSRGQLGQERVGHRARARARSPRRCTPTAAASCALTTMRPRHVEVGRLVDVDVAVAVAVDHVRHRGVLEDRRDQRRAAARDEAVDRVALAHELDGRLAARVLDQHERVGRAGRPCRTPRAARRRWRCSSVIAPDEPRRKAALPRLEAQAGRVAGDVRPVLVDDRRRRRAAPAPG